MSNNNPCPPPTGNNNNNNNGSDSDNGDDTLNRKRRYLPVSDYKIGQTSLDIELLEPQDVEIHGWGPHGIPTGITVKGQLGITNFIAKTIDPDTTVSKLNGDKGLDVLQFQTTHHFEMHNGQCKLITAMRSECLSPGNGHIYVAMRSVPFISKDVMAPHSQILQSSASERVLVPAKNAGMTEVPAQPPAPAQAPAQGQGPAPCPNCGRADHVVGYCVGPPNPVHGDLPACPICDTFAGRVQNGTGPPGHQFDDCRQVQIMLHSHGWDKNRRLKYQDLAGLTKHELLVLFNALVVKRQRKAPIRTKLVCWIDVLREITRRSPNSDAIASLSYMTPWTKEFASQQRNWDDELIKAWDCYDYASGNTQMLPASPVEQIEARWKDFVVDGFPQFPPQVFNSSDRKRMADRRRSRADGQT